MRETAWQACSCQDEIGWAIDPRRWGEGLAAEAAVAAIADGFERCGLDEVIAFTTPDNQASRRVMVKCGLELRGTTSWKGSTHVWYAVAAPTRPAT